MNKKLGALLVVSIFFSGASFDNNATVIPKPVKDTTLKVQVIDAKFAELDSLLLEIRKYEVK